MDFEKLKLLFDGRLEYVVIECYGCCEGLIESWTIDDLIEYLKDEAAKVKTICVRCRSRDYYRVEAEWTKPDEKCWRCGGELTPLKEIDNHETHSH